MSAEQRRRARRLAEKQRELYGTRRIDATPAREHVQKLVACDIPPSLIAWQAGCSHDTCDQLLRKKYERIDRDIARGLLAVPLRAPSRPIPEGIIGPRWAARRRVQALMALGWPIVALTGRGFGPNPVLYFERRRFLLARAYNAVLATYDELQGTPGPSEKSRRLALASGYHPPLAWDDIDDPYCKPMR